MTHGTNNQTEPIVFGEISEDELMKLAKLRQDSEQIVHQIGLNRVAEQRLMQQLQQAERNAQVVLNQAGARLGIPDGTPWQVTSDGKAIVVRQPRPVPQQGEEAAGVTQPEASPEG